MKPGNHLMRLIGGTAFWVVVALLLAGYLAPLAQYLEDDVQPPRADHAEVNQGCPS